MCTIVLLLIVELFAKFDIGGVLAVFVSLFSLLKEPLIFSTVAVGTEWLSVLFKA